MSSVIDHTDRTHSLFVTAAFIIVSTLAVPFAQSQQPSTPQTTDKTKPSGKTADKPMAGVSASENVIEILTLDIKPGRRDEFHELYVRQSLPLLKKWNIHVAAYGPSLHDADSYYIIRVFKSLEERQQSEDAFYGSDDWKNGPREAILALVDHFAYAVVSAETWKSVSMSYLNNCKEVPHGPYGANLLIRTLHSARSELAIH